MVQGPPVHSAQVPKSCMQIQVGQVRFKHTGGNLHYNATINTCLNQKEKKSASKVPICNSFTYLYPSENFYDIQLSYSRAYFYVLTVLILSLSSSTIG